MAFTLANFAGGLRHTSQHSFSGNGTHRGYKLFRNRPLLLTN